MLESSQVSDPILIESPQTVVQTLGAEEQLYPDSIRHVDEHPSFEFVPPSSQVSGDSTIPFPQVEVTEGLHELGHPEQV